MPLIDENNDSTVCIDFCVSNQFITFHHKMISSVLGSSEIYENVSGRGMYYQ